MTRFVYMPDASISADAIVAFNETEEQFENTLALVADVADLLNTAAYSPREHQRLCGQNQLSEQVSDRLQRLNHLFLSKQSRDRNAILVA